MNKTLFSAALIAGCGIAAFNVPANAATGTMTFNGKVLSSTCSVGTVTGGSATGNNVAVTLPDVQSTNLAGGAGTVTGLTPFSIGLTGCPTSPSGVVVGAAFSGASIDNATGAIKNTSGGTNSSAEIQMTDGAGTAINLNTNTNPVSATISGTGTATLAYQAQYYQPTSAAVTAGTVTAVVSYTLTYN